jgi:hypothetical protein
MPFSPPLGLIATLAYSGAEAGVTVAGSALGDELEDPHPTSAIAATSSAGAKSPRALTSLRLGGRGLKCPSSTAVLSGRRRLAEELLRGLCGGIVAVDNAFLSAG